MIYAGVLGPDACDSLAADLRRMDRKTGIGWISLVGYLGRFGSVPSNERALASILDMSVKFLQTRAWPLIADRLVNSEDGKRYFCPDVPGPRSRPRAQAPEASPVKSPQQQAAALARWSKQRMQEDAKAHAEPHAERMHPDAETHVISMHGASETHEISMRGASPDASGAHPGASAPAGADSLSQEDSSSNNSPENPGLERESAPAGADAPRIHSDAPPDAPEDAPRMQSDAPPDAPAHAPGTEKRRSARGAAIPIPDDWAPSAAAQAEAKRCGADIEAEVAKFRDMARSNGTRSFDWDASFMLWLRRYAEYIDRQRKIPLVQSLPGGKEHAAPAEPEEAEEPAPAGPDPAAQMARVQQTLRKELGKGVYRNWLSGAALVGIDDDGEVTISVPTRFLRDQVTQRYGDRLTTLWRADNPEIRRVNIVVAARRADTG
jgi:DnaA-like protein